MPAIVGFVGLVEQSPTAHGRALMAATRRLGPDGSGSAELGRGFFGTQFYHTVPEDDFDRQPYIGGGGQFLLAADARVDNRQEIASALNISPRELVTLSDVGLVLLGWERWGIGIADRILGDAALAVWDANSRELALVRTPLSNRPIFYCQGQDFIAFASLPSALLVIPEIRREPDVERMTDLLAGGIYLPGADTMFRGIQSVPHGQAVLLRQGTKKLVNLWSGQSGTTDINLAEAGEAMRAELDRAVKAHSRRRSGPLACQLSAGRDSSAVTTSAAWQQLEPIALTAAPRDGFPPVEDSYWLGDESQIAAQTALRSGVRHVICRSDKVNLNSLLRTVVEAHFQPVANPVNLPWIAQTCSWAERDGAPVLLTGACGNFALSLGGAGFLGEYWRERGLQDWWTLARGLQGRGETWLSLMSLSFGHLVPHSLFHALWRLSGRGSRNPYALPLLKGPTRQRAEQIRKRKMGDARAPASRRSQYAEILKDFEIGDKYSLASWRVDVRDPTADRRLVELCHSLPVEAFLSADQARPAYAAAFGDRMPDPVIEGRRAGYQAANWFETICPDEVRTAFRAYSRHPLIDELFDLRATEALIDVWPTTRGNRIEIYEAYCHQLFGALALASFIDVHFPA